MSEPTLEPAPQGESPSTPSGTVAPPLHADPVSAMATRFSLPFRLFADRFFRHFDRFLFCCRFALLILFFIEINDFGGLRNVRFIGIVHLIGNRLVFDGVFFLHGFQCLLRFNRW